MYSGNLALGSYKIIRFYYYTFTAITLIKIYNSIYTFYFLYITLHLTFFSCILLISFVKRITSSIWITVAYFTLDLSYVP